MIRLLIKHGANVNAKVTNPLGWCYGGSSIKFAFNNLDVIKLLVENGADANDQLAITSAIYDGKLDVVKYLVEHGAQVDIYKQDRYGSTILSTAQPEIEQYLKSVFGKDNENE